MKIALFAVVISVMKKQPLHMLSVFIEDALVVMIYVFCVMKIKEQKITQKLSRNAISKEIDYVENAIFAKKNLIK